MASFVRRRAFLCAIALLLFCAATAIPQPKLESSSLGGWRGFWQSELNPMLNGPVQQVIDTERNRRVSGMLKWLTNDWQPAFELELRGTTSASCIFNYELMSTPGDLRMTMHGTHMPGLAMGGYMLFNPGEIDHGQVLMVQNFDRPGAPNVEGHYMGSFTSSVLKDAEGNNVTGPFTFYVFDGRLGPAQVNGNFWGEMEVPDPLMEGELLEFSFAGRIDDEKHSLVVGAGNAGIFMVDMHYTPAIIGEDGQIETNAMFEGHYHVNLADGSEDMGTFAVTHNPNFGQEPPPIIDRPSGQ